MTDFYSVLRKAVDGLADNNAEARKALYARAESALVAQLASANGNTSDAQIEEVRKSLQQAAQRIEGEEAVKEAVAAPQAPVTTATAARPYVSPLRQGPGKPGAAPAAAKLPPATPPRAPAIPAEPVVTPAQPAGLAPPAATLSPSPPAIVAPPPPPPPNGGAPELAKAQSAGPGFASEMQTWQPSPDPHDWPEGTAYVPEPPRRRWGLMITLLALGGLAGLGYWQRDVVLETIEPVIALVNPGGQDAEKNEQRLPTANGETPEPVPPAPAVIEALLIEEPGQDGVAPTQVAGSVNWALRQQDGIPYIEGLVQVPERGLTLKIDIFRNRDPEFPATHTIDFYFQNTSNATAERVENVPGLLAKQTPRAAGGPLAGEVVKVDDGVFLMALYSHDPDAESNRIRLREQPFFDVPVVYASGKRAIITLAKGTEGQSVFQQAFEAWGQ